MIKKTLKFCFYCCSELFRSDYGTLTCSLTGMEIPLGIEEEITNSMNDSDNNMSPVDNLRKSKWKCPICTNDLQSVVGNSVVRQKLFCKTCSCFISSKAHYMMVEVLPHE